MLVVMDTCSFISLQEASISPGENICTEPSHLPRWDSVSSLIPVCRPMGILCWKSQLLRCPSLPDRTKLECQTATFLPCPKQNEINRNNQPTSAEMNKAEKNDSEVSTRLQLELSDYPRMSFKKIFFLFLSPDKQTAEFFQPCSNAVGFWKEKQYLISSTEDSPTSLYEFR